MLIKQSSCWYIEASWHVKSLHQYDLGSNFIDCSNLNPLYVLFVNGAYIAYKISHRNSLMTSISFPQNIRRSEWSTHNEWLICILTAIKVNGSVGVAAKHYSDVIMRAMASQITGVYSNVCSDAEQRKHQSSVTGEFAAQRASNEENVSIWWRHHVWHIPGVAIRISLRNSY